MRRTTVVLLGVLGLAGAVIAAGFVTRSLATDASDYRVPSESMLPTVEIGEEGCDFPRPITIRDGHYLLLGDNRGASDDSRFWGPVPVEWIEGRVEDCDLLRISCSPIR